MNKLSGSSAELAERLAATPEAADLVRRSADAAAALRLLRQEDQLMAAVRLVSHALPAREGVWWACMCADHTAPADLPEPDRAARQAAEQWVRANTSDAYRRAAMNAARKAGMRSPEAWAGVGAFWSGGSMAPEGQPVVPPAPHLCGTALAGSVLLASVRGDPRQQPARLTAYLDSATDIARGGAGRLSAERT
nr:hypothetical protein [uncultured Rhodopila sp.]